MALTHDPIPEPDPFEAADRIEAFLDRRAQVNGLDPEEIQGMDGGIDAGGTSLLVSDLREVVRAFRQIHSDWVQ